MLLIRICFIEVLLDALYRCCSLESSVPLRTAPSKQFTFVVGFDSIGEHDKEDDDADECSDDE